VHTLPPLLGDAATGSAATLEVWNRHRDVLRDMWLEILGPLSARHLATPPDERTVPALRAVSTEEVGSVRRTLVEYRVESDQLVEAYLLVPTDREEPLPGVVVFHSTVPQSLRQPAGVEGEPEKAFGLVLAERGFVTICPRNYLWPESDRIDAAGEAARFLARHPESKGMDRMLLDGLIAVDILASLPEVDPGRIGCVGHSLGAKEGLYLAAFDERVRATVSSEGGIGIKFSNWNDAWYLGSAIDDPAFPREHHELLALAAPRAFLLIGGDSADGDQSWPYIAAALPVWHSYGEPARLGLWNHKQGHSVPEEAVERIAEWLQVYLAAE
jgi:dienelactone hydrolase